MNNGRISSENAVNAKRKNVDTSIESIVNTKVNVDTIIQRKFAKNIYKRRRMKINAVMDDILKTVNVLQVNLVVNGQNVSISMILAIDLKEVKDYKCAGCNDIWIDRACMTEHVIENRRAFFCLNCDDWIRNKSKVFEHGWKLLDKGGFLRTGI